MLISFTAVTQQQETQVHDSNRIRGGTELSKSERCSRVTETSKNKFLQIRGLSPPSPFPILHVHAVALEQVHNFGGYLLNFR